MGRLARRPADDTMSLLSVPAPLRDFRVVRYTKEFIRLMVRNQTAADWPLRVWPLQADVDLTPQRRICLGERQ